VGLLFFAPCEMWARIGRYGTVVFLYHLRPQQVVWHWRRCTQRGPGERRIYKHFSYFYPFGVPITPTVLRVGGDRATPFLVWR